MPTGRWGGQVLVTHREPGGRYTSYTASFPSDAVAFDTTRADLTLGGNTVRQADGRYTLRATLPGGGGLRVALTVVPAPHRFFPPVELREGSSPSGYVVPALAATASGTICRGDRCGTLVDAPAYHDHNWGVWRDVTWDWGAASGARFNVLYGAVYAPEDTLTRTGAPPIFVALVDSLGVRQILRSHVVRYDGRLAGRGGVAAPARFEFLAARDADTLRVRATILDVQATRMGAGAMGRSFLQMRGSFTLEGMVAGAAVADSGMGFFETYVE